MLTRFFDKIRTPATTFCIGFSLAMIIGHQFSAKIVFWSFLPQSLYLFVDTIALVKRSPKQEEKEPI